MITVETGAGVQGANSYASIEDADIYHAARANTEWQEAQTDRKRAALIRATDYLEAHFRAGARPKTLNQGLQWPVEGDSETPSAVVRATIVLALYGLESRLSAPAKRGIKVEKTYADGSGIETTFDDAEPGGDPYPEITAILANVAKPRRTSGIVVGRLIK